MFISKYCCFSYFRWCNCSWLLDNEMFVDIQIRGFDTYSWLPLLHIHFVVCWHQRKPWQLVFKKNKVINSKYVCPKLCISIETWQVRINACENVNAFCAQDTTYIYVFIYYMLTMLAVSWWTNLGCELKWSTTR